MKQLDFTLSLIDKLSRPLKQAQSSVTGFAEKSKAAFMQIGGGVLALAGTGMTIRGALSPAIEMYDALNDAASKGIDDQALKAVQRDALRFSTTYGASAVEFVQSTESINSAIAGLTGNELPKVTKVANTLAFALKSTAAETAEFMGQMFGNFSADAERLGRVQFAEQLAGKMVYMRKVFGTEMGTIKDLMEGARGVGTNYGVGLDEQLAVLGQLNRTLGTEASSAYEGFMTGAIEGGKKLGLSFTDATGKMLSMPEMLIKLQGKYGKSLEGNLKAQAELDAAFGDSSAVVKHLYGNVALLQRNITELGGSDGLKRTQEMASKLVKPWDRFVQILKAIQTVIGLTLIPVLYPVLNRLADMGQTFARWMQLFPNIARVIGYAAMALLGFAAVGAVANIVMGASKFIMAGLRGIWVAMTAVTKAYTAMVWLAQIAVIAWNATLKFLRGALLAVRMAAIMAGIGINLMSWPVLLVIGAIALLAAGCWLLIKHWDTVKAAVMETSAFQACARVVAWLAGVFSTAWQFISEGWNSFIALLTGFSPSQALSGLASGIVSMFDNVWQSVKGGFLKSWNWIVEKLNKIPGVDISMANEASSPPLTVNNLSTGGELKGIDKGGISKSVSNNSRAVTDNSRKINTVNIYPKEMITPGQLMEFQELGV
ncbi:phage tail tape measure protein [Salmonella enterica subsp. enterica serovar Weltevreden]|uniref:Phage tail tape measure protein n=1 Tax=Salmonella enterica subsp. enterica serovar Weltevreden TaxID=57743 RepID=A0A3U4DIN0_SALET|nr:phage tail tape measure protein [Salmonella enterica]EAA7377960.1 phage tail tape measure protein [Salmonella enterica subsp. enterica]EBX2814921.1 phage tail tape measure protein [Salmonella enterica subsp. enterica serovar Richmond]ECK9433619.1 phage tail tape measure protein [Salmonella enterica subsp. enterica serovar Newport]EDJ2330658.1 phage tail tape measure protein [Salmonella enterica subsp. enterica serovar Mbandaka]MCL8732033.1 phage tail tape measure protein [Salmonella enteric